MQVPAGSIPPVPYNLYNPYAFPYGSPVVIVPPSQQQQQQQQQQVGGATGTAGNPYSLYAMPTPGNAAVTGAPYPFGFSPYAPQMQFYVPYGATPTAAFAQQQSQAQNQGPTTKLPDSSSQFSHLRWDDH
jgi:hypothetical protein